MRYPGAAPPRPRRRLGGSAAPWAYEQGADVSQGQSAGVQEHIKATASGRAGYRRRATGTDARL